MVFVPEIVKRPYNVFSCIIEFDSPFGHVADPPVINTTLSVMLYRARSRKDVRSLEPERRGYKIRSSGQPRGLIAG
jgi:hypothetical protein